MGLTNGDPNVIYPILFQILSNFDRLAKRAYVARFLVPIDIPKEYLYDEGLAPTNTEYIQLRAQFKELHKEADEIRKQDVRPSEIKQEITQLEVRAPPLPLPLPLHCDARARFPPTHSSPSPLQLPRPGGAQAAARAHR